MLNLFPAGFEACKGRSIRMDKLDTLVTQHLADRLLTPERLTAVLGSLAGQRAVDAQSVHARMVLLQKEADAAEERVGRLYKLVEDGTAATDEVLKDRIAGLRSERDRARAPWERAQSGVRRSPWPWSVLARPCGRN